MSLVSGARFQVRQVALGTLDGAALIWRQRPVLVRRRRLWRRVILLCLHGSCSGSYDGTRRAARRGLRLYR